MDNESVTQKLANYAATLSYEDIPEEVRTVVKQFLLDWFGITIAGSQDPASRLLFEECLEAGGTSQASIFAKDIKLPIAQAALVNGFYSHAQDFTDINVTVLGPTAAAVPPSIIALAERDGASGRDLLVALVAGVELMYRVGLFLTPEHYDRGWHSTGIVGTFGAAAGASRLLNLEPDACAIALGIAGTQAAGLKCMFGSMCKPFHLGKAASNGLLAALLARRGFSSRSDVLECVQGFGETHTSCLDPEAALGELGQKFYLEDFWFKYYPTCFPSIATIEAAQSIRNEQAIASANIDRIEIRVPASDLRIAFVEHPATGMEIKFSHVHTCAMALAGKNTTRIDSYNNESCVDPILVALRQKTRVIPDESFTTAIGTGISEVTVFMKDGSAFQKLANICEPERDLPTQARKLENKFLTIASPVIGEERAREAIALLSSLETLDNLDRLMELCRTCP